MPFETDFTKLIFEEINNPKIKQKSIALTYALLLVKPEIWNDNLFLRINNGILARFGVKGLNSIKTQAHRAAKKKFPIEYKQLYT